MGAKKFQYIFFSFLSFASFFLDRVLYEACGGIYIVWMDGIDIRGYEYLEGGRRGEHRWDELTKRDGDLQAFVNTPFLFYSFSKLYQTFFFLLHRNAFSSLFAYFWKPSLRTAVLAYLLTTHLLPIY